MHPYQWCIKRGLLLQAQVQPAGARVRCRHHSGTPEPTSRRTICSPKHAQAAFTGRRPQPGMATPPVQRPRHLFDPPPPTGQQAAKNQFMGIKAFMRQQKQADCARVSMQMASGTLLVTCLEFCTSCTESPGARDPCRTQPPHPCTPQASTDTTDSGACDAPKSPPRCHSGTNRSSSASAAATSWRPMAACRASSWLAKHRVPSGNAPRQTQGHAGQA